MEVHGCAAHSTLRIHFGTKGFLHRFIDWSIAGSIHMDCPKIMHKKMKTEPNQALQTISRTGPVAAEPLCGPALEMSDF